MTGKDHFITALRREPIWVAELGLIRRRHYRGIKQLQSAHCWAANYQPHKNSSSKTIRNILCHCIR